MKYFQDSIKVISIHNLGTPIIIYTHAIFLSSIPFIFLSLIFLLLIRVYSLQLF